MPQTQKSALLLGALTADAASLGLHWLYDPARIAEIADARGSAAFVPVDAGNFEDVKGYFAHAGRHAGMLSQYGEVLWLAMRVIRARGGFEANAYRQAYGAHFGPGGAYHGYIDRPTRAALTRIAADETPTGLDDDQLPATATLPAIMAVYHGQPTLPRMARTAREVTNINETAEVYSVVFADLLSRVLKGEALPSAMASAVASADPSIRHAVTDALKTDQASSTDYAGKTGRACHLPMAGPLVIHILRHATSYGDAVERNIRAGGDSAGRAILIGAVMGAVHGIEGPRGIPLDWVLRLQDGRAIWEDCRALAA